jgi:putative hydrolase of the HAD superfamily
MTIRAVIFDIGGVVRESAVPVVRAYEKSHELPAEFVANIIGNAYTRRNGPIQRLERGEIILDEFCRVFDEEFVQRGHTVSTAEIIVEMSRAMVARPIVVEAIRRLRARGLKAAALTNTWYHDEVHEELEPLFDVYLESRECRMRKPEKQFLERACAELGIGPGEIAYLDEAGRNLKPARRMGMTTIKVIDPRAALAELGEKIGFPLVEEAEAREGEGPA